MLSKTQFKEWFDRYKYVELAATSAALLGSQFSRIFSGLTTAYLLHLPSILPLQRDYWHVLARKQKNKAIQQKTTFRRC
jgi:hypothetical protein